VLRGPCERRAEDAEPQQQGAWDAWPTERHSEGEMTVSVTATPTALTKYQ
jgi:hypothetical protein